MRKRNQFMLIQMLPLLLVFCFLCNLDVSAAGYATFNNHKLVCGVKGQFYYVHSSASSEASRISTSFSKWSNGTPISYKKTSTKSASRMDFYKYTITGNEKGVLGYAEFFTNDTNITSKIKSKNWYWNKITLCSMYYSSTSTVKQRTVCHEMGHAFGLAHKTGTKYLMNGSNSSSMPTYPTSNEKAGIKKLY